MTLRKLSDDMPSATFNFEGAKKLDGRITFTRASYAPANDPNSGTGVHGGTIQEFNVNVPRLTDKGLLIEESRTNLITTADLSTWDKDADCTVAASTEIAPDGSTNAWAVSGSTGSTGGESVRISAGAVTETKVLSVYAKSANGSTRFNISFYEHTPDLKGITFSLSTGEVLFNEQDIPTFPSEYVGNGWWRFFILRNPPGQGESRNKLQFCNGRRGSKEPGEVLIWGPQSEVGNFATSYIPTSGATVTRAADLCEIKGTTWDDMFSPIENSLVVEGTINYEVNSTTFSVARTGPMLYVLGQSNNSTKFWKASVENTNRGTADKAPSVEMFHRDLLQKTGTFKASMTISAGTNRLDTIWNSVSSDEPRTDGAFQLGRMRGQTFTGITIGGLVIDDNRPWNGTIERVCIYNTALSNVNLEVLTQ